MKADAAHHMIASTAATLANFRFREMMKERGEATDAGPFSFEPWAQWSKPFRFAIDDKTASRYGLTEEELQPLATQAVRDAIVEHKEEFVKLVLASERAGASFWQDEKPR